jgi:hypothetical protein
MAQPSVAESVQELVQGLGAHTHLQREKALEQLQAVLLKHGQYR